VFFSLIVVFYDYLYPPILMKPIHTTLIRPNESQGSPNSISQSQGTDLNPIGSLTAHLRLLTPNKPDFVHLISYTFLKFIANILTWEVT